jgi:hypothetical protein
MYPLIRGNIPGNTGIPDGGGMTMIFSLKFDPNIPETRKIAKQYTSFQSCWALDVHCFLDITLW